MSLEILLDGLIDDKIKSLTIFKQLKKEYSEEFSKTIVMGYMKLFHISMNLPFDNKTLKLGLNNAIGDIKIIGKHAIFTKPDGSEWTRVVVPT